MALAGLPVIAGDADTHAALWYLLKNPSLSATARRFMDDAAAAGRDIVVSPISACRPEYVIGEAPSLGAPPSSFCKPAAP